LTSSDEWGVGRETIGKLDGVLGDLRKFSFSLITGVITASAFLQSFLGATDKTTITPPSKAAVIIAITALVTALFGLDRYYTVLLNGAVTRCLDIEQATAPANHPFPTYLTEHISFDATRSRSPWMALLLYLALLLAAFVLGIAIFGGFSAITGAVAVWGQVITAAAGAALELVAYLIYMGIQRGLLGRDPQRGRLLGSVIVVSAALIVFLLYAATLAWGAVPERSLNFMLVFGQTTLVLVVGYFLFTEIQSGTATFKAGRLTQPAP
jgi:hypothetical protein